MSNRFIIFKSNIDPENYKYGTGGGILFITGEKLYFIIFFLKNNYHLTAKIFCHNSQTPNRYLWGTMRNS